jgi:hypothetical protein
MASRRTTTTTRQTKVTSRRATPEEVEGEPEVKKGLSMPDAVAIITFLLLLGAILITDYHLGHHLNDGMFFKS